MGKINNIKVAENFKLSEFEDTRTGEVRIDPDLIKVLQQIRTEIGKPIQITSGYRTKQTHVDIYKKQYSDDWGDHIAWGSKHLLGKAVDFTIISGKDEDYEKSIEIAIRSGLIHGIGNGFKKGLFIHIDTRDSKEIVRWNY